MALQPAAKTMLSDLELLIEPADDIYGLYTGLANAAAHLYGATERINWLGFYLVAPADGAHPGRHLVLGPFMGLPACTSIGPGKGVCGKAVMEDSVQRIADVHDFPGHIACDAASRSELVVPLHNPAGEVVAVLDIDSPEPGRFSVEDAEVFLQAARILEGRLFAS